jgi:hypothetical protein|tara:strand:+ start:14916 stop:15155 length:240 start_codon:yes stop_codon:yes gene_type:complete
MAANRYANTSSPSLRLERHPHIKNNRDDLSAKISILVINIGERYGSREVDVKQEYDLSRVKFREASDVPTKMKPYPKED